MTTTKKKFWDNRFQRHALVILPGEFHVSSDNEVIVTTLGSCVSACIRDRVTGLGGMNHFMLPKDISASSTNVKNWMFDNENKSARYGSVAMELLINTIIKMGGSRLNLEAKIFGGSLLAAGQSVGNRVGDKNVAFVKEYLAMEKIPITDEDVSNPWPMKIYYIPANGESYVQRLRSLANQEVSNRERQYSSSIEQQEVKGGITYL